MRFCAPVQLVLALSLASAGAFQTYASITRLEFTGPTDIQRNRRLGSNLGDPQSSTRRHVTSSRAETENELDFDEFEEKERKELHWLVKATAMVLGESTPPPGSFSVAMISRAHSAMKAWAQRSTKKNSNAPHVVEQILTRLVEERDAGNEQAVISTKTYNVLIDAWSKSDEDGAAQRAEEILVQMERMYDLGNHEVQPNAASYTGVIKAWVKNGNRRYAVTKAEGVIERMTQVVGPDGIKLSPNRRGYNLLLYALANSMLIDSAERAEAILLKMTDESDAGNVHARPDVNSYNQVITAWARGRRRGFEYKAQAVFNQLMALPEDFRVKPNTDTFNAILGCWLKSTDNKALTHVMEILDMMEKSYATGNNDAKPDRITVNTVFAALARGENEDALEKAMDLQNVMEAKYKVKPDTVSNNILMDSWTKSGKANAPDQVLEILDRMEKNIKRGKVHVKPDAYSYASVIDCFVKCGKPDAGNLAEEIIERMNDMYQNHGGDAPPVSVYNACINAWASSTTEKGVDRAEAILREMEDTHGTRDNVPAPNRITYNTVLKALRSGSLDHSCRAEELLSRMEERSKEDESLAPDSYTYTAVITAYGRSNDPKKAVKALGILKRMIAAYQGGNMAAKPNVHSFNAALNACAFTIGTDKDRIEAFVISVSIMVLLQEYAKADHMTYGTILRACSTLLPSSDERRDQVAGSIFKKACREGQVGKMVITQLKFACSRKLYESLMQRDHGERLRVQDLPSDWTCNVCEQSTNRRLNNSNKQY